MTELAASRARVSVAGFDAEAAGVTPPINPDRRGAFLTDVIVELGFADQATLEQVLETTRRSGTTIERSLLDSGVLDEEQLSLAIAERNGLDHVDLDRFDVDMEAAKMVSRSAALRYRAVPIAFAADGALIVAMEDPFDSLGINDIEAMTRSEVRPAIAAASGINGLIERLPDEPATQPPEPEWHDGHDFALSEQAPEPRSGPPAPELPPEQAIDTPEIAPAYERPEPAPESATAAPEGEQSEVVPTQESNTGRDGLSVDLHALQEAAHQADALAAAVGRQIGELKGAEERAEELERELAAAQEQIAALEERLSGVSATAGEARAARERLDALCRALEEVA
jgi:hypothetical protein